MATAEDVQRIALSLQGTTLDPGWGRMLFRRQRIFAVLPDDGTLLLRLLPEQRTMLVGGAPETFAPFKGRGPQGVTVVQLSTIGTARLEEVLRLAWQNGAPKSDRSNEAAP